MANPQTGFPNNESDHAKSKLIHQRHIARVRVNELQSGWGDSNSRPPAPKAGALTKLRYTPYPP